MPGPTIEIIISDSLILVNNADAPRIRFSIPQEIVVFNQGMGSMTHGKGTLTFKEYIVPEFIPTRFVGDNFVLTIDAVEIIISNNSLRVFPGKVACTNS